MKKKKSLYEGMYILSAQLSEEARTKALERITSIIEQMEGEVHKVLELGRKKLAYEIRNHRDGYYFLLYFELETARVDELIAEYQLNEDLIRFMLCKATEVKEKLEFRKLVKEW